MNGELNHNRQPESQGAGVAEASTPESVPQSVANEALVVENAMAQEPSGPEQPQVPARRQRIVTHLESTAGGDTVSGIAGATRMSVKSAKKELAKLLALGSVKPVTVQKARGIAGVGPYPGYAAA